MTIKVERRRLALFNTRIIIPFSIIKVIRIVILMIALILKIKIIVDRRFRTRLVL